MFIDFIIHYLFNCIGNLYIDFGQTCTPVRRFPMTISTLIFSIQSQYFSLWSILQASQVPLQVTNYILLVPTGCMPYSNSLMKCVLLPFICTQVTVNFVFQIKFCSWPWLRNLIYLQGLPQKQCPCAAL